jgi:dTDP-4-amino-4,6-dideoxygalactose transaminase
MNEACAAMGLTSLESLDEFVEVNYRNYKCYQQEIASIPGIFLLPYNESEHCNYQYIVLEIDEKRTKICRDTLVNLLNGENIVARRYFYPGCHRMEPYRSYFPHAGLLLPETEQLTQRVMLLPTGTAMDIEGIVKICNILRFIIQNANNINRALVSKDPHHSEAGVATTINQSSPT